MEELRRRRLSRTANPAGRPYPNGTARKI